MSTTAPGREGSSSAAHGPFLQPKSTLALVTDDDLVERIFERIRASDFLNVPHWRATEDLGISWERVRELADAEPSLEVAEIPRRSGDGAFEVVRPAPTPEG